MVVAVVNRDLASGSGVALHPKLVCQSERPDVIADVCPDVFKLITGKFGDAFWLHVAAGFLGHCN